MRTAALSGLCLLIGETGSLFSRPQKTVAKRNIMPNRYWPLKFERDSITRAATVVGFVAVFALYGLNLPWPAQGGVAYAGVDQWATTGPFGGDVEALAVDTTTSPSTIYAGTTGGGVFRSTNGGASWVLLNNGLVSGSFFFTDIVAMTVDLTTSPAT